MAFNVRSGGNAESVPVASGVESGDVVRIGNLVVVSQSSAAMGRDGVRYATIALEGIADAEVDGALTVGQAVYTSTAAPTGTEPAVVATLTAVDDEGNKVVGIVTRAKS